MSRLTRRSLLQTGVGGFALVALGSEFTASARDAAVSATASRALSTVGTTLEQVATGTGSGSYRRLVAGPGLPLVVREELASAGIRRDDTRSALASFVQLTDLHIVDAQSPMRFEFMMDVDPTAFRPHEALGTHAAAQLVTRINELRSGPFSGRDFDCVVSTGDNSDNRETIELDWFLKVMDGGTITANTGSATRWEGVQSTGSGHFYRPESDVVDRYQRAGFPQLPGYFDRAIQPHSSPGLETPWYSVFGNHDDSIGGAVPAEWSRLDEFYTGGTKFTGFTSPAANGALAAAFTNRATTGVGADAVADTSWQVTPDERRAPFTPAQFVAAHFDSAALGAGPAGHGFTADSPDTWYSFGISPGVTGIALDSTNAAGFIQGSLGDRQLRWLEATLKSGSSRFFERDGGTTTHSVDDEYFVIFSHHTSWTMANPHPDPRHPDEERHLGFEVKKVLERYPNVVAWVNGHTHSNRIRPHYGKTPTQSFWEINTASHVEFPQQARVIDVCNNGDGTLSLFTTLIESAAPYQASYTDGSQEALASVYREFALNDLSYKQAHEGQPNDHNTELLLVDPLGKRSTTARARRPALAAV